MVTFKPRDSKIEAVEAAAIPLPKDDTTPPVIKIYLVTLIFLSLIKKRGDYLPLVVTIYACLIFS
jgi:hypothetical protein